MVSRAQRRPTNCRYILWWVFVGLDHALRLLRQSMPLLRHDHIHLAARKRPGNQQKHAEGEQAHKDPSDNTCRRHAPRQQCDNRRRDRRHRVHSPSTRNLASMKSITRPIFKKPSEPVGTIGEG